jgi:hypothetical protein
MLEFIGIMTIIYLIAMGLARLFGGKQSKREIYIIREYEIEEESDEYGETEQLSEEKESHSHDEALPGNVVPIHRKKR